MLFKVRLQVLETSLQVSA
uniref:Uncharacterized protein n=1 Tax=Anguilla anguilla TaxID=7936 RepID=A0A0E9TAD1_ANGAN